MTCEHCGGSGWVIVETNGVSAAQMCVCRAHEEQPPGKPLTVRKAAELVEALCQVLNYAPETVGRAIILDALMKMCATEEQAVFTINRACALHTEWKTCGIRGLRQILCSRYTPKDGISIGSTDSYPDGIPTLRPPEPALPRLPPGVAASCDVECERAVLRLAEAKTMNDAKE